MLRGHRLLCSEAIAILLALLDLGVILVYVNKKIKVSRKSKGKSVVVGVEIC